MWTFCCCLLSMFVFKENVQRRLLQPNFRKPALSRLFPSNSVVNLYSAMYSANNLFLKQRALPNVLVNFFKLSIPEGDQNLILKNIKSAIEASCGKDRYVIYSIDENELKLDSKIASASVLLLIHDQYKKIDNEVQAKIPKFYFDLGELCPGGLKNFNLNYFSEKIHTHIIPENQESSYSLEQNGSHPIFLIDTINSFENLSKHKYANDFQFVEFDNCQEQRLTSNHVLFIDYNEKTSKPDIPGFNTDLYFNELKTKVLGRSLLFCQQISSTMDLVNRFKQVNGIVGVTNYQTQGIGRRNNQWLSPLGCAMFTLNLNISVSERVMKRVSLFQHLASLSIIMALPSSNLNVKIKWPNDILYVDSMSKMAGILARSCFFGNTINLQIGFGINVSNKKPSICLDDIISHYNAQLPHTEQNLKLIPKEEFIARVVNNFETLLDWLNQDQLEPIKKLYCQNWIHSDNIIDIQDNGNGNKKTAQICGIDDHGYLLAIDINSDELLTLQPDGNRFDLMHRLVILNAK